MWSPVRPTTSNPVPPPAAEREGSNPHSALPLHGRAAPVAGHPVARTAIIGKSLVIKGEVEGSEPLQIEGRVEGSLAFSGNYVSIGRDGVVAANVVAQEVVIRGTLRGNLTISDRVEIHGGGSVVGDIAARRISIENGAHFQGSIDMRRPDPKAHLENASDTGSTRLLQAAPREPGIARFPQRLAQRKKARSPRASSAASCPRSAGCRRCTHTSE